jgi:aryl-alcohol dehydrogenase-like predicted oxidoreductase
MKYVTVGATGVQVSPLCFGAMSFGSEADEATSAEMFGAARDAGINFFDTADVYGAGQSEEILRRLIASSASGRSGWTFSSFTRSTSAPRSNRPFELWTTSSAKVRSSTRR